MATAEGMGNGEKFDLSKLNLDNFSMQGVLNDTLYDKEFQELLDNLNQPLQNYMKNQGITKNDEEFIRLIIDHNNESQNILKRIIRTYKKGKISCNNITKLFTIIDKVTGTDGNEIARKEKYLSFLGDKQLESFTIDTFDNLGDKDTDLYITNLFNRIKGLFDHKRDIIIQQLGEIGKKLTSAQIEGFPPDLIEEINSQEDIELLKSILETHPNDIGVYLDHETFLAHKKDK